MPLGPRSSSVRLFVVCRRSAQAFVFGFLFLLEYGGNAWGSSECKQAVRHAARKRRRLDSDMPTATRLTAVEVTETTRGPLLA